MPHNGCRPPRKNIRFAISPFREGQANTVGIAMRRALLNEIEGASITYAKIKKVKHEYSTIIGLQESIHDILINLKEIFLKSESFEPQKAYISVLGPTKITAQDIKGPSSTINKDILLEIELNIEKDRGYRIENLQKYQEALFPVYAVFMPIRNKKRKKIGIEKKNESNMSYFPFQSVSLDVEKMTKDVAFKHIFIDQLELPARAYNCLKKVNVQTIADLLQYSEDGLIKIKNFGEKSVEQ
ncbi:hypothetical protein MARPO_0026s0099, partial [Marchantia polymorpha]